MTFKNSITALILAGGRGSRMGHVDKGLMPFRGANLVTHVMQRLAPQVSNVAISANQNQNSYAMLGVPVWSDELTGFAGPLAGLQTGLRHCATEYLLCAPCDSPFVPPDLALKLFEALQEQQADLTLAVTMETDAAGLRYKQAHPVFCLLKTSLLPLLTAYLQGGGRRMDGWHDALTVAEVLFDDAGAFRNINTLDELKADELNADAATLPPGPALHSMAHGVSAYDPEALPVWQARRLISDVITPLVGQQQVALRTALDRVLANDIVAPINVPAYDNSAMDGYALRGFDLSLVQATTLSVVGAIYAGRPSALDVLPGQCVRIMTGAVMPPSCDSVIPQELVAQESALSITIAPGAIRSGDNRRLAGEDLKAGSAALKKGKIIRPAELGLLASLGIAEVAVQRRLRVAFFSTGDELRSIGEHLDTGCVYDSNRYTLFGMLTRLGCDIIDMGIVKDDPQALETALRSACENADAVITSGGVSVGAADYTRQIMATLGAVSFWKIGMRPGRPMAFGKINSGGHSAFLFGLPGNPVAVMVTFYAIVRDALLQMMGAGAAMASADQNSNSDSESARNCTTSPPLMRAISQGAIRKRHGRTEYQRGILSLDACHQNQVRITGAQGSGILSSMSEANCMVVLHDEQGNVSAGDMVDVLLFEGLV